MKSINNLEYTVSNTNLPWSVKMWNVINECLNVNSLGSPYSMVINTNYEFTITKDDVVVFHRITIFDIPSHWRKHATEAVQKIISDKIQSELKKY